LRSNASISFCAAYVKASRRQRSLEGIHQLGGAEAWLTENDPEGVAFEYQLIDAP
jgi:hypothetical protein